ncbi:MAG: TonB-dependent receptor [Sphingopyxis sp.]|nr:TonB-dependent receptor [Sphingopyxis sp.]
MIRRHCPQRKKRRRGGDIVVTGSRIQRPNEESTVPITSLGGQEFFETGNIAIGDTLNELPQLRSTLGQQQSAVTGLGNAGLNLLDLRGLGTLRTLVLVNGRRHVGGDIQLNGTSVDINTIPTALVERVDIVTGGNSAIYGSDAIAGVVNFVLRRNFEGIEGRVQAGISDYGDAGAYYASLTAGQNFADGRGNVALSVEYGRQDRYFGATRPHIARNDGFITIDTDPAGTPNGSDGIPDTQFFRDIRSATFSNTGTVVFNLAPTATANCGTDPLGNFYNCPHIFQSDGTLVPQTGARTGLGPNGSFIGGNGENFRGGGEFELAPQVDRIVANMLGRFEFSDAAELFTELKYSRIKSVGTGNNGPGFIVSAGNAGDQRQLFRLDNPFLSAQARTLITNTLLTTGRSTGTVAGVGGALTPADIAAINAGTFRVRLQESFLDLGRREQRVERETYRAVVGLRGDFNDDWNYEISANYGEFKETETRLGNINRQRLLLALDAARETPTSAITCRSSFDPTARVGLSTAGANLSAAERAAILAADVAACVPLNYFGGQFTPQQAAYVTNDTFAKGKITQFVANAFMSGDLSQLFELPGGPVGFAVGAEYRRETNSYELDPLSRNGYTVFNAVSTFESDPLEVKEVFGEIRIPLLADQPFFEALTFTAAGRYADYSGSTGGVFAWNVGGEWAPVQDLRFRANWSRAVRAPLLSEQFAAPSATFIAIPNDPCSLRNRGTGTSFRAANCLALGVPANFDFVYNSTPVGVTTGNPNLKEESSDSFTVGGVLQPRWVPGLTLSVDYYDVKVKDVISSVAAQTALNQCVDLPTIDNQFCTLFRRNAGPGLGPQGEEVGRVLEGSYLLTSLNFASRRARGLDFEAAYRRQIDGLGLLDLRATWTHVLERSNFESPVNPNFANVLLQELGDPKDEVLFRANLATTGGVNLTYSARYIGKQYVGLFESFNGVNGQNPLNADQFPNPFVTDVFYHNFRVGIEFNEDSEFYLGVDNAFNRKPPLGFTGIGPGPAGLTTTTGIYDNRGRFFYAGVRARL